MVPARPAATAPCGHRYQEGGGRSKLGLCGCGLSAIGGCSRCGSPFCGECMSGAAGARLCRTCGEHDQAAAAAEARARDRAVIEERFATLETERTAFLEARADLQRHIQSGARPPHVLHHKATLFVHGRAKEKALKQAKKGRFPCPQTHVGCVSQWSFGGEIRFEAAAWCVWSSVRTSMGHPTSSEVLVLPDLRLAFTERNRSEPLQSGYVPKRFRDGAVLTLDDWEPGLISDSWSNGTLPTWSTATDGLRSAIAGTGSPAL